MVRDFVMNTLSEHYGLLLGLNESWRVAEVDLQLAAQRVEIRLESLAGRPMCCAQCGERRTHGRFTSMFEAFALCVLQAAGNVEQARKLLGLTWESVQSIMDRAVERGLKRRELGEVRHVGIDEKSFGRGHDDSSHGRD